VAVSASIQASELRDLLRAAFRRRLEPSGWEMDESEDGAYRLAVFRYRLHPAFAATAELAGSLRTTPRRTRASSPKQRFGTSTRASTPA
jgi:hypothetical protein